MKYFNELLANMIPGLALATYIPVVQSYNKGSRLKFSIVIIIVSFFFLSLLVLGGKKIMKLFEFGENAVTLAGGIILLVTSISLIFEKPNATINTVKQIKKAKIESEDHDHPISEEELKEKTQIKPVEKRNVSIAEMLSWAIVPITFPLIIGPGVIAWALKSSAETTLLKVIPSISLNLFIQFITLIVGNILCQLKNSTIYASILKKVLGFILACVGSKYVLNSTFDVLIKPHLNKLSGLQTLQKKTIQTIT